MIRIVFILSGIMLPLMAAFPQSNPAALQSCPGIPFLEQRLSSKRWQVRYIVARAGGTRLLHDAEPHVGMNTAFGYIQSALFIDPEPLRPKYYVDNNTMLDISSPEKSRAWVDYFCWNGTNPGPLYREDPKTVESQNAHLELLLRITPREHANPRQDNGVNFVGLFGKKSDAACLRPLLGSKNVFIVTTTARALFRLGDLPAAKTALQKLIADKSMPRENGVYKTVSADLLRELADSPGGFKADHRYRPRPPYCPERTDIARQIDQKGCSPYGPFALTMEDAAAEDKSMIEKLISRYGEALKASPTDSELRCKLTFAVDNYFNLYVDVNRNLIHGYFRFVGKLDISTPALREGWVRYIAGTGPFPLSYASDIGAYPAPLAKLQTHPAQIREVEIILGLELLGVIGSPETAPVVEPFLVDNNPAIVRAAAVAAFRLGKKAAAIKALRKISAGPVKREKLESVVDALGLLSQIDAPAFQEASLKALERCDQEPDLHPGHLTSLLMLISTFDSTRW